MALSYKHFTIGVEEEYMVIDPQTRELKSHEQKLSMKDKSDQRQSQGRNAPGGGGS